MPMANSPCGILGLLDHASALKTPAFQRSFAWEKEQVIDYWDDLASALDHVGGPSDYFLGLVVIDESGHIQDGQPRQSKREMVSGESHYFLGRRFRLRVTEFDRQAAPTVVKRPSIIELNVRAGSGTARREAVLDTWYRERLREIAAPLVEKWQAELGVEVSEWGIKRMKTKWGSCNAHARRVWLNLELVKSPPECIEYIVVHELVHLAARRHDERFFALMDRYLPGWRARRELLNSEPLPHVVWPC